MSLRTRQKKDRSNRILEVARTRFQNEGYGSVTIESIAAEAEVSAVTVYNYYESKANLLLALVKESDVRLISQLEDLADNLPEDIQRAVAEFGRIMRKHAMTYLTKSTWREVLAASILEGGKQFGTTYRSLDQALIELMARIVQTYQGRGTLARNLEADMLANTLFQMQNIRFFLFISDENQSEEEANLQFHRDVAVIFADKFKPNLKEVK
ncbi:TetR/AcrR family transcriptional regulator [Roseovarius pelagicus]|uniref:TetR/AcrR family transcriptional regulator n=1 Tax=Roseovarius pelagicus TaxID=2980108 RepID=A0ABY6D8K3_9RHOB|nr:TetR/AcrR family transcriptional regulator [Roseovarius pelagicus]UXX82403.1 TetR/AcrR family transcriptional regulator [Roseovarius pelagicus]